MLKKISFVVFSLVLIFGSFSITQAVSEVEPRGSRFRERQESRDFRDTFCDRFGGRFFVSIFCPDEPAGPVCGNEMKEEGEECDGTAGVGEHQMCNDMCELVDLPFCGDGMINQPEEECDGTAGVGEHEMCSNQCEIVVLPFCGDEVVNQPTEECDTMAGVGEHQVCDNQCQLVDLPFCGDGMINQPAEECDGTAGVGAGQVCSNQCLLEDLPPVLADHVVINEVYYDVDDAHGTESNEWVELYNPTGVAVDVTNWMIGNRLIPTTTIPSLGFAFVTSGTAASSTTDFWSLPTGTVVALLNGSISSGLNNTGDNIRLENQAEVEVDALSYGSDTSVLSPAVPVTDEGHSLSRTPNGVDTDTADDWTHLPSPTPGS